MVLYFSGTGNSRFIAKKIAEITDDEIISINSRIKNGNYEDVQSEKPLVFVGPVYAGRYPRIMEKYIEKVTFYGTYQAYFIATCAAEAYQTEKYVKKLCDKKLFSSMGFNSVVMPQGYIALGGTQSREENNKTVERALPKIKNIAYTIREMKPLQKETVGSIIMSKYINPVMYSFMINAKGFKVTNKCTSCGKCVERCPLNNITLVDGKPTWGNNCTHCMACIGGCPTKAVEYGKKTVGKPRHYLEG